MRIRKSILIGVFVLVLVVSLGIVAAVQDFYSGTPGGTVPGSFGYAQSSNYGSFNNRGPTNSFSTNPGASRNYGSSFQNYNSGGFGSRTSGFSSSNTYRPGFQSYYSGSDIGKYWPALGTSKESCQARQDVILQVAPAGCQPVVVRSDLLADQDVPVFCQIDAFKINPLLDIRDIRNIRFSGEYPPEVVGAGFHPARAALRGRGPVSGGPLVTNIGYVAVILKRNPNESSLPDFVNVTFRAKLDYDSVNAFGIGRSEFKLKEQSEDEWRADKQTFWNGGYSIRLEQANGVFSNYGANYYDTYRSAGSSSYTADQNNCN